MESSCTFRMELESSPPSRRCKTRIAKEPKHLFIKTDDAPLLWLRPPCPFRPHEFLSQDTDSLGNQFELTGLDSDYFSIHNPLDAGKRAPTKQRIRLALETSLEATPGDPVDGRFMPSTETQ